MSEFILGYKNFKGKGNSNLKQRGEARTFYFLFSNFLPCEYPHKFCLRLWITYKKNLDNIYIYDIIVLRCESFFDIFNVCLLAINNGGNKMAKKTITELLLEATQLRQREKEIKAQMKAQKQVIAIEYADNLSPEAKAKQIAEAEAILKTAEQKAQALKAQFIVDIGLVRDEVSFAREILEFVNYKHNNSLPKRVNEMVIEGHTLSLKREGLTEIKIDVSKADWRQTFKAELKKKGINGDDRIADNLVFKALQLINSNK